MIPFQLSFSFKVNDEDPAKVIEEFLFTVTEVSLSIDEDPVSVNDEDTVPVEFPTANEFEVPSFDFIETDISRYPFSSAKDDEFSRLTDPPVKLLPSLKVKEEELSRLKDPPDWL